MNGLSVTEQLLQQHVVSGEIVAGEMVQIEVDQTLMHDVGGTMIMLELDALGVDRVVPQPSVLYVDHNLLQVDERNSDDHRYLRTAAERLGVHYSPAGNGISHPVHAQLFGRPGASLVGCDSHTPTAGSMGMLAFAAGGLVVALTMAGRLYPLRVPRVWGIELVGKLPDWVSAKDLILELLRRHGVQGGNGFVVEYFGEGLRGLSVMDRQVIANMGTELGAVTSVFPSDERVREFLIQQGRLSDWMSLRADDSVEYDRYEQIDLSSLVPLIALPHSPGNVVPVEEVEGLEVGQVVVGSSANPGYRDLAVIANGLKHAKLSSRTALEVNPSTRQVTIDLAEAGLLATLAAGGARINQSGCLGCCGMGQAPATNTVSLRTVPRNFRGRSGVDDDRIYLCSPETAFAAAVTGRITDPRKFSAEHAIPHEPTESTRVHNAGEMLMRLPPPLEAARQVRVIKGPHIKGLPALEPLPDRLLLPVALKLGDDVSTDDIMPSGAEVLSMRSDIPSISRYVFRGIDAGFADRVDATDYADGHALVAGNNYGQGSAREHAALALRHLGLRAVLARGFARIHVQNLAAWGVIPLVFCDVNDYQTIEMGAGIELTGLRRALGRPTITAVIQPQGHKIELRPNLTPEQVEHVLAGGSIPYLSRTRPPEQ